MGQVIGEEGQVVESGSSDWCFKCVRFTLRAQGVTTKERKMHLSHCPKIARELNRCVQELQENRKYTTTSEIYLVFKPMGERIELRYNDEANGDGFELVSGERVPMNVNWSDLADYWFQHYGMSRLPFYNPEVTEVSEF